MDIIASPISSSAASTQASASSASRSSAAEPFSLAFSQASEASSDSASASSATPASAASTTQAQADKTSSTDANIVQIAPKSTTASTASSKTASKTATASEAAEETDLAQAVPVEAEPALQAEPVELPVPAAPAPVVEPPSQPVVFNEIEEGTPITEEAFDLDLNASAEAIVANTDADTTDGTDSSDSTLDDIRQRMDLIQRAGQLDASSMIVVQAIPVQVAAPVATGLDGAGDTGSLPEDAAALSNVSANLQSSIMASADTPLEVDPDMSGQLQDQDTVQTLTGLDASVVQDVNASADSALVDNLADSTTGSETPSSFSLASLTLNSAGVAGTDKVAGNGLTLSAAIGSSDWQSDLGQQVIDMIKRGEKQMDLRLHPADLGPLSISLNLNDGNTQAQFQSAHASVRAAVEQALPQLRDALASQGITLGQASVSDESSRQAAGQQARRDAPTGEASTSAGLADSALEVEEAPVQNLVVGTRGVDLYV
ncbi:flagellar hook-length control protein FliK [Pseudomonas sp. NPDC089734]|uniref:flagellar hook-length control protein FliK n=1 Tax=Pseudomonas sp. NPDC089734 TaxID=3364469 RepID=UPI003822F400